MKGAFGANARRISCNASGSSLTVSSVPTAMQRPYCPSPKSCQSSSAAVPWDRWANSGPGSTTSTSEAKARSRSGQALDGQPMSSARSTRRTIACSRSRLSSNARSRRKGSPPVRAARSRRRARSFRSNRSVMAALVRSAAPCDKSLCRAYLHSRSASSPEP